MSWTHAVVCLPNTFLQALSKLLPEGDEQDNATDGKNDSGGGVADRRAYRSPSFEVHRSFALIPMAAFSMENWPVLDDTMREELIQLQDTHQIVSIPAYESSGELPCHNHFRVFVIHVTYLRFC